MTKFAFLTDIHANLPALDAVLDKIKEFTVDEILIGGDTIGIGPYPKESLKRIMTLSNCIHINGNHELIALYGLSSIDQGLIQSITEGEKAHTEWCSSQLDKSMKTFLKKQPLSVKKEVDGIICYFSHLPIDPTRAKSTYPYKHQKLNKDNISQLFSEISASLIGFGHIHKKFEIRIKNRTFFTPGSLGCYHSAIARFATIDCDQGQFDIQYHAIKYDDSELFGEFERRNVPDRKFIWKTFFGGKLRKRE